LKAVWGAKKKKKRRRVVGDGPKGKLEKKTEDETKASSENIQLLQNREGRKGFPSSILVR